MRSSFLVSVDVIEFHTVETYSNLHITGVKYNKGIKGIKGRKGIGYSSY
jgi:hypothetical protein